MSVQYAYYNSKSAERTVLEAATLLFKQECRLVLIIHICSLTRYIVLLNLDQDPE